MLHSNILLYFLILAPTALMAHSFQDDVVYFILPDRFFDADPDSNWGGDATRGEGRDDVLRHGYLPSDKGYYHGGDLKGVILKLPYLQKMGVTAIWLSPVFKNKPVQPDPSNLYGHSSGYHGYWILDFLSVDPHLGTNEDFRHLVDEAHARNMKIFCDVITNHTADVIQLERWPEREYQQPLYGYMSKLDMPYRDAEGAPFDDIAYAYHGQNGYSFPSMTPEGFPYRAMVPLHERQSKRPAWLNDPGNYHNRGNMTSSGENSLYGDFFGLDDLFTEKREVVEGMVEIYSHWIKEYRVDGFRIDTTRHVNVEFWQIFGPAIMAAAKREGIGHFFTFGEVADSRPSFLSYFSTRARLPATLDFAFQAAARDFVSKGKSTEVLADLFRDDDYYTDIDSSAYTMPTFLGNHDMGRIGHFLKEDNPRASDGELLERAKMAHALMFFARGTPVVYYGDEQGFTGDGGDKDAREDMLPSKVTVYNDNDLIGTNATTADSNFDTEHPLYQAIARYADVRRQHRALRSGIQLHRYSAADGPGIYAFSRIAPSEKIEYVVAFNNREEEACTALVPTYHQSADFHLILTSASGPSDGLKSDKGGKLAVTVPPLGFVIYRASKPLPPPEVPPEITVLQPLPGSIVDLRTVEDSGYSVPGRLLIEARLSSAQMAEVTFAVQPEGSEYFAIGTDPAPPYRVFWDPTAGSTRVNIRATVCDALNRCRSEEVHDIGIR